MAAIHPSSVIIEAGAKIGAGVKIGPFCLVGADVVLGDGSQLHSHVVLAGRTTIGPRARIYPFASIGHPPQDLKYAGEASTLVIGADCTIREGVTMNPGTAGGMHDHARRRRLPLPRQLARRPRLPDRQQRHLLEQRHARRPLHASAISSSSAAGPGCTSSSGSASTPSSAACQRSRTMSFPTAWRSATGLISPASTSSACGGAASRRDQIHDLRRAYRLLFAQEGTLSERRRTTWRPNSRSTRSFTKSWISSATERIAPCARRARRSAGRELADRRTRRDPRRRGTAAARARPTISSEPAGISHPGLPRLCAAASAQGGARRLRRARSARPSWPRCETLVAVRGDPRRRRPPARSSGAARGVLGHAQHAARSGRHRARRR